MFTTEITGFEEEPLFFDDANNSVHIAKGATAVGGIGEQLKDPTGIHDNSYLIDGSLQNNGTAIGIAGAHDTVSVGETGHVFGASVGIDLSGNANRVSNSGEIVGASYAAGILVSGGTGTHIRNDGLITGGVGVNFEGDNGLLVNGKSGVITGNTFAIGSSSDETGNITFVNHGLIIGSSGTAFQSESKTVILINDGTIKGDVDFGDGGGTFDNRGGVIKGAINGGAGDDTFIFAKGDTGKTQTSADLIKDFSDGDTIDLSAIDAIAKSGKDDAFKFLGTHAFTHHAGEMRYGTAHGDTWISADTDGDGKANLMIHLDHALKLEKTDFDL